MGRVRPRSKRPIVWVVVVVATKKELGFVLFCLLGARSSRLLLSRVHGYRASSIAE